MQSGSTKSLFVFDSSRKLCAPLGVRRWSELICRTRDGEDRLHEKLLLSCMSDLIYSLCIWFCDSAEENGFKAAGIYWRKNTATFSRMRKFALQQ